MDEAGECQERCTVNSPWPQRSAREVEMPQTKSTFCVLSRPGTFGVQHTVGESGNSENEAGNAARKRRRQRAREQCELANESE